MTKKKISVFAVLCIMLSLAVFSACVKIPQVTVTFETNQGTAVAELKVDRDGKIESSPTTTRDHYTFGGWYDNEELSGTAVTFPYIVTEDQTLYASWTINEYTVKFNVNEGSAVEDIKQDYNTKIETAPATTKSNNTFMGWFNNAELTGTAVTFPYTITKNETLYAKWDLDSFTVKFNENDGSAVADVTQKYNTTISTMPISEKQDYKLLGWYDNADLTGEPVSFPYTITKNETLYAKWALEDNLLVLFDAADDSRIGTLEIASNGNYTLPRYLKKDYTMEGVYSDKACTTKLAATLDASAIAYVKFIDDGLVYETANFQISVLDEESGLETLQTITDGYVVRYDSNSDNLNVVIEAKYNDKQVYVLQDAFYDIDKPESDIVITNRHNGLISVTFADGIMFKEAFNSTYSTSYIGRLKDVDTLKTVIFEGRADGFENTKSVFENCASLDTLILGEGFAATGRRSFVDCTALNLKMIVFPDSFKVIGFGAFRIDQALTNGYDGLGELDLSNTKIEVIGENAFTWYKEMTSVLLPETLKTIGNGAFSNSGLSSITLPNSVTTIGASAFANTAIKELVIPELVTAMPEALPAGLTKLVFGKSVAIVNPNAFNTLKNLVTVEVDQANTSIKFDSETGLLYTYDGKELVACLYSMVGGTNGTVTVADGVEKIGQYVFREVGPVVGTTRTGITTLVIPASVNSIDFNGFYAYLTGLVTLTINEANETYAEESSIVYVLDKDKVAVSIAYVPAKISGAIKIKETIKTLSADAFAEGGLAGSNTAITMITLPRDLEEIQAGFFNVFKNLTKIWAMDGEARVNTYDGWDNFYLFEHVLYYKSASGVYTFAGVPMKVAQIYVPVGLKNLVDDPSVDAFSGRTFAYMIAIPDSVEMIADSELAKLTGLAEIYFYETDHKAGTNNGDNGDGIALVDGVLYKDGELLFIPIDFMGNVVIEDSVTSISTGIFTNRSSIKQITIGAEVATIDSDAFVGMNALEKINIGANTNFTTDEGGNILFNSTGDEIIHVVAKAKDVVVAAGVKRIFNTTFANIQTITSIEILGATRIYDLAFSYMRGLEYIILPTTLTRVDEKLFDYSINLKHIFVPFTEAEILANEEWSNDWLTTKNTIYFNVYYKGQYTVNETCIVSSTGDILVKFASYSEIGFEGNIYSDKDKTYIFDFAPNSYRVTVATATEVLSGTYTIGAGSNKWSKAKITVTLSDESTYELEYYSDDNTLDLTVDEFSVKVLKAFQFEFVGKTYYKERETINFLSGNQFNYGSNKLSYVVEYLAGNEDGYTYRITEKEPYFGIVFNYHAADNKFVGTIKTGTEDEFAVEYISTPPIVYAYEGDTYSNTGDKLKLTFSGTDNALTVAFDGETYTGTYIGAAQAVKVAFLAFSGYIYYNAELDVFDAASIVDAFTIDGGAGLSLYVAPAAEYVGTYKDADDLITLSLLADGTWNFVFNGTVKNGTYNYMGLEDAKMIIGLDKFKSNGGTEWAEYDPATKTLEAGGAILNYVKAYAFYGKEYKNDTPAVTAIFNADGTFSITLGSLSGTYTVVEDDVITITIVSTKNATFVYNATAETMTCTDGYFVGMVLTYTASVAPVENTYIDKEYKCTTPAAATIIFNKDSTFALSGAQTRTGTYTVADVSGVTTITTVGGGKTEKYTYDASADKVTCTSGTLSTFVFTYTAPPAPPACIGNIYASADGALVLALDADGNYVLISEGTELYSGTYTVVEEAGDTMIILSVGGGVGSLLLPYDVINDAIDASTDLKAGNLTNLFA